MDLSVAVDKLISMTVKEIVTEALALPVCHKPRNSQECLITNLLRHWGVRGAIVDSISLYESKGDVTGEYYEVSTPGHVTMIINVFDNYGLHELMRRYNI